MFREVPMVEVREVLRLRQMGYGLRRTAALLGLDRKTVRRYLAVAEAVGFRPESSEITDGTQLHPWKQLLCLRRWR